MHVKMEFNIMFREFLRISSCTWGQKTLITHKHINISQKLSNHFQDIPKMFWISEVPAVKIFANPVLSSYNCTEERNKRIKVTEVSQHFMMQGDHKYISSFTIYDHSFDIPLLGEFIEENVTPVVIFLYYWSWRSAFWILAL